MMPFCLNYGLGGSEKCPLLLPMPQRSQWGSLDWVILTKRVVCASPKVTSF